ncbi:MAG: alanine--tRNA ligase [Armatimonadota bacterium]
MTGNQIRETFLTFFAQRGHQILPSSSLVPEDPTTLFTTAGMQQFVPWFRREVDPPYGSVATVQKCARTDDLDHVGHTARHHTFFEMLGNFSFGDYFKKESLRWGWELSTLPADQGGLGLDPACIWVTYYQPKPGEPYQEDLETRDIWKAIGVPEARIVPLGKKENWWGPVGDSGPCGPCSEMHYDRGAHLACGPECTSPACGCDRWIEFWNHVFQQFNFQDGEYLPLPIPGIDTGAGLERIASLVQKVETNFDTDLLCPLLNRTCELADLANPTEEQWLALRVIADHLRCAAFMIADGVLPSNNRRGYVVRRIIRRAYRFGRVLDFTEPFLFQLVPVLVEIMGGHYHELCDNADFVTNTLRAEETRFAETLERGEEMLHRLIAEAKLSAQVHQLSETLVRLGKANVTPESLKLLAESLVKLGGIPITSEQMKHLGESLVKVGSMPITSEQVVHLGENLLKKMKHAGESLLGGAGASAASEEVGNLTDDLHQLNGGQPEKASQVMLKGEEVFTLYDTYGFPKELTEETARAAGVAIDEAGYQAALEAARERARAGGGFAYEASAALGKDVPATEFVGYQTTTIEATLEHFETDEERTHGIVVLDRTPFYATSGGQCGDHGSLLFDGTRLPVVDVTKDKFGHVLHAVDLTEHETFYPGPRHTVTAVVDEERRNAVRRAHTSTHLLHWALHQTLGEHAKQAGSLVDEDYLRFDFSHPQAMTAEEIRRVEDLVYDRILHDAPVVIRDMSLKEARKEGYTALFGEKYGDWVRTVNIGGAEMDVAFSRELCGGTHLDHTGQAGFFVITSESSVAAGIRRIEALTGRRAVQWAHEQAAVVQTLSAQLRVPAENITSRIDGLQQELRDAKLKVKGIATGTVIKPETEEIGGVQVMMHSVEGADSSSLGTLADRLMDKLQSGVVVLATATEGKVLFAVKVSKDLTGRFHAGNIVKEMAALAGGGGGGRPDFAQAGGRLVEKIPDALVKARELIGKA